MFAFRHFLAAVSGASLAAVPLTVTPAAAGLNIPLNVSSYEVSLGSGCTLYGVAATCSVQFAGWTGGAGATINGWRSPPGNGFGWWTANINYLGKAAFGASVKLAGGTFDVTLINGFSAHGVVTEGSVVWPANRYTDIGCGAGAAYIALTVNYTRGDFGSGYFRGCLRDLPAGSAVPPRMWGMLML